LKPEQLDAKRLAPSLVRSPLDDGDFLIEEDRRSNKKTRALSVALKGLVVVGW
jgi:hypothetical protein